MVTEGELSLILTRIFDKLDGFEEKIDKICVDRLSTNGNNARRFKGNIAQLVRAHHS